MGWHRGPVQMRLKCRIYHLPYHLLHQPFPHLTTHNHLQWQPYMEINLSPISLILRRMKTSTILIIFLIIQPLSSLQTQSSRLSGIVFKTSHCQHGYNDHQPISVNQVMENSKLTNIYHFSLVSFHSSFLSSGTLLQLLKLPVNIIISAFKTSNAKADAYT